MPAPLGASDELTAAVGDAVLSTGEPCTDCQEPDAHGLCTLERCQRAVLPVLDEPSWRYDVHSGLYHEVTDERRSELDDTSAVRKAKRRNARRKTPADRFDRALRGERAPTRHRRI